MKKFVCSVCGYVYEGEAAPAECPVCHVGADKFIEQGELFDTSHPRYRAAVLRALDCLCRHDVVFEINTGAIARGLRTSPYPEPWIREEIRARGKRFIRNSDCHKKELLLRAVPGSTGYRRF